MLINHGLELNEQISVKYFARFAHFHCQKFNLSLFLAVEIPAVKGICHHCLKKGLGARSLPNPLLVTTQGTNLIEIFF